MAETKFTPTVYDVDFAFRCVEEELETLGALVSCLVRRLEPANPDDRATFGDVDIYSWRLAQAIEERLESAEFINLVRRSLLGKTNTELTA